MTLNTILSDIPSFLGRIPVSDYVKDLLATEAIASIPQSPEPNAQSGVTDKLVFDNPLMISIDDYFLHKLSKNNKTGNGNSFADQLSRTKDAVESIEVMTLHNRESLDKVKEDVAESVRLIEYPALRQALLTAFSDMVEDVVLRENSLMPTSGYTKLDVDKESDVLEALIKPYPGNLIYIDFWALWCAPCRMGMIEQQKAIEHFTGQPLKVLYVADDSDIAASNQWLEKKGIGGTHIFLSKENWERISEYFGFKFIPFGVLIGRDGKLLKTHFNLEGPNAESEIERHLQF